VVKNADALVTESTYMAVDTDMARANGHLTATQAARLARDNNVKQLILTHISGRYRERDIEDEARSVFANSTVARDFDAFKIRAV
jgi:ribonuclease Z